MSNAGHVFSCASPCTELGAKYAEIFGADETLAKRLGEIQEKLAQQAAGLKQAKQFEEAEKLADEIKQATRKLEEDIAAAHPRSWPPRPSRRRP